MRTRSLSLALLCALFLANCYGSFSLTRKIYNWNGDLNNKFVRSAVFWVLTIVPVYEAGAFVDAVLLNTIEFWMGENPVSLNGENRIEKTVRANGKIYNVAMGQNQILIRQTKGPDVGKELTLILDETRKSWFLKSEAGMQRIVSFDKKEVVLFHPNGQIERIPM